MSSFWDASDKIPVKQTKVAIQAERGLDYSAGQKITIHIPPTVQYFQPKESYLKFEVQLDPGLDKPMRAQLDSGAGAQVLIKDIRILSGGSGSQLLEEYQDYNVLTALKYDFEVDATIRSKRALTEGTTQWDQTTRGTKGTTRTHGSALANSPYTAPYQVGDTPDSASGVWGDASSTPVGDALHNGGHKKVKVLLPLHTGIFQNSKVFPCLLTEGLRIEILLERADRVVKMLDTCRWTDKTALAPVFHSAENVAGNGGKDSQAATQMWGSNTATHLGGPVNMIYIKRDNNQLDIDNFPFVVGESFTFVKNNTPPTLATADAVAPKFTTADGTNKLVIKSITKVAGAANTTTSGGWWVLLRIELVSPATQDGQVNGKDWVVEGDGNWSMVSTAVAQSATVIPSYTISGTELILQQLEMPPGYTRKMMSMMKAGGVLNYDFLSSTNYKYSQLKGDIVANIRLPLSQSRAKSILSVPTDATAYSSKALLTGTTASTFSTGADAVFPTYDSAKYTFLKKPGVVIGGDSIGDASVGTLGGKYYSNDGDCFSDRAGYTGVWDNMSDYQWYYNGQLNPNRKVDVSKITTGMSISQQGPIELEKALAMAGIRPLSFAKYLENACIGRALSLQDGVYDTRGRDFNLQCNYEKSDIPTKNKLWMNYVFHIRRLVIRGDAISLEI